MGLEDRFSPPRTSVRVSLCLTFSSLAVRTFDTATVAHLRFPLFSFICNSITRGKCLASLETWKEARRQMAGKRLNRLPALFPATTPIEQNWVTVRNPEPIPTAWPC